MSEEMKTNILKYLTNNLQNEEYNTNLVYSNVKTITTNLATQLNSSFTNGFDAMGIVQGKNINGNQLNYSVLWGNYLDNSNTYGFLAIIDDNANLVQLITKYTSNVKIGEIYTLNVDEEGNFFMIEYGIESSNKRFVMLNNIVVKLETAINYIAKIRKAYAIPDTSILYSATSIFNIVKAVGQARYCIFASRNSEGTPYLYPMATELVINVGSENEWNDYDGIVYKYNNTDSDSVTIMGTYATWVEDSISFMLLALPTSYNGIIAKYYNSNTTMAYDEITYEYGAYSIKWGEQAIIMNNIKAYFCFTGYNSSQYAETHDLFELDLANNTSSDLYTQGGDFLSGTTIERLTSFILDRINNELFFIESHVNDIASNTYDISVGRIRNDNYYINQVSTKQLITATITDINDFFTLYVNKQFNLYNFNVLLDDNVYNTTQIYNSNNYNGIKVENYKSLLPNSGILYDDNNNVIFARNLYNKTINGQTTVSTIEVPNTYINNITIAKQDLLSFNNNLLVDNQQNVITNQYETLNINFINKISILNDNLPSDPIYNNEGAATLNTSFSNTLDYQQKIANKIKIHYTDERTVVNTIPSSDINYDSINNIVTYTINVYVPSYTNIDSIDIMSNDETTVYQTIQSNTLNLQNNKYYTITQDVIIN